MSFEADPAVPADPSTRANTALGIIVGAGALAALLAAGWIAGPVGMGVPLVVAVLGGAVAGVVAGSSREERAAAAGAAIVATVGIALAVRIYVVDRSSVYNLELLLPVALGGLPGYGVHLALKRFVARPGTRAVAALGVAAVTAVVALVAAPSAGGGEPSAAVAEVGSKQALPLSGRERDDLRAEVGDRVEPFFTAVDKLNAIAEIYGPASIAKAGASGQALFGEVEQGLAGMRGEADRRIAAGEPAAKFGALAAVEPRVRAFLARYKRP